MQEGKKIVSDEALLKDAIGFTAKLLKFKAEINVMVKYSFNEDINFSNAMEKSFQYFMNKYFHKCPNHCPNPNNHQKCPVCHDCPICHHDCPDPKCHHDCPGPICHQVCPGPICPRDFPCPKCPHDFPCPKCPHECPITSNHCPFPESEKKCPRCPDDCPNSPHECPMTSPMTPHFIAAYCDNEFKKGLKGINETETNARLDAIIDLFRCLYGRDIFIK